MIKTLPELNPIVYRFVNWIFTTLECEFVCIKFIGTEHAFNVGESICLWIMRITLNGSRNGVENHKAVKRINVRAKKGILKLFNQKRFVQGLSLGKRME